MLIFHLKITVIHYINFLILKLTILEDHFFLNRLDSLWKYIFLGCGIEFKFKVKLVLIVNKLLWILWWKYNWDFAKTWIIFWEILYILWNKFDNRTMFYLIALILNIHLLCFDFVENVNQFMISLIVIWRKDNCSISSRGHHIYILLKITILIISILIIYIVLLFIFLYYILYNCTIAILVLVVVHNYFILVLIYNVFK